MVTTDMKPGRDMDAAVARALRYPTIDGGDDPDTDVWFSGDSPFHWDEFGEEVAWYPSENAIHAIAALDATGNEYQVQSIVGDPGHRRFKVDLYDGPYLLGESGYRDTLAEAACIAILAWSAAKTKETTSPEAPTPPAT